MADALMATAKVDAKAAMEKTAQLKWKYKMKKLEKLGVASSSEEEEDDDDDDDA
jgi:hypothetical protein